MGRVSDRSEAFGSSDGRTGRLNVDIVSRTPCIDITLWQSGRLLTLARGIHHFMTDSELLMYVSGADGRLMVNAMSRGDRVLRLRLTLWVSIPTINNLFRRAVYTHPGTRKNQNQLCKLGTQEVLAGHPSAIQEEARGHGIPHLGQPISRQWKLCARSSFIRSGRCRWHLGRTCLPQSWEQVRPQGPILSYNVISLRRPLSLTCVRVILLDCLLFTRDIGPERLLRLAR